MGIYDSPPNMPKLRYLYRANNVKGLLTALAISTGVTAVCTYYIYQKKIVTARRFFETYDPDLEWQRLRNSGILKSVDKDGNLVDMFD